MTLFALDNDIDNFNNILSSNFALKINYDRNEHLQLGMYLFTNPVFFNIVQNAVKMPVRNLYFFFTASSSTGLSDF